MLGQECLEQIYREEKKIFVDAKGELYKSTAKAAEKIGIPVKIFNVQS